MLGIRSFVLFIVGASAALNTPNLAWADASMDRVLKELEPEERAHQACNLRGIDALRKATHLKVDRVKTSILNPAIFKDNVVIAKGGAVRANNHWYMLNFTCTVTADQMKATSFDFKLGSEIPEAKWEDYGLWR
jgi:hypothetical protein